jgi:hypothetical protein
MNLSNENFMFSCANNNRKTHEITQATLVTRMIYVVVKLQ